MLGIPIGITSSIIGLKIWAIAGGIKIHKSIIKKNKKKHNKKVLLAEYKLNSTKVLNSKVLIGSNITHDEFILINVLKEYEDMGKKIKSLKT